MKLRFDKLGGPKEDWTFGAHKEIHIYAKIMIYVFPCFAMHLITMDLLKSWWLTVGCIFFLQFIFYSLHWLPWGKKKKKTTFTTCSWKPLKFYHCFIMKMSWKYIETIDWFDCNLVHFYKDIWNFIMFIFAMPILYLSFFILRMCY